MKELNDIINAYDKALAQKKQTALATVVKVEGSSYRRPGARMLITEDGEITGAISGGCLEGDALRKAQFAIFQQQNKLEIYDTTDDEHNAFGVQLGCNGVVYILFEPIVHNEANNPLGLLKKIAKNRKGSVIITLFNTDKNCIQKGTCCFLNENESFFNEDALQPLHATCTNVLATKSSVVLPYENNGAALFQFISPAMQLIIAGAGNDAQPLVNIAFLLGWNVIVLDGRTSHVTQQRFPNANTILLSKPAEILSAVNIDEQTAVVLMTHNYNYDTAILQQLLTTNCIYTGLLGPKNKMHKMLDDLREKGVVINDEIEQHLYGPVGLDIGAEPAEEIAVSIIAEIKAVFAKRPGTSLSKKATPIHERSIIAQGE